MENFDRQRPNAEWGGVCGVGINPNDDMYGVEKVAWGNPSKDGNPLNSERLGYRQLNMKEIGINGFCVFLIITRTEVADGFKNRLIGLIQNPAYGEEIYLMSHNVYKCHQVQELLQFLQWKRRMCIFTRIRGYVGKWILTHLGTWDNEKII